MNQRFQQKDIDKIKALHADNELYTAIDSIGRKLQADQEFALCAEECFIETLDVLQSIIDKGKSAINDIENMWLEKFNNFKHHDLHIEKHEIRKSVCEVFGFAVIALNSSKDSFYSYLLANKIICLLASKEYCFDGWNTLLYQIADVKLRDGWFDDFANSKTITITTAHDAKKQKKSATKPKTQQKITNCTYHYRWNNKEPQRITLLYQALIRGEMIDKDTNPENFEAIFSGQQSTARVKWIASRAWLWYLLNEMQQKKYIEIEGESIWIIASSHFVDKEGKLYDSRSFSKCKPPRKAATALDSIVEILNTSKDAPKLNIMDDDPDSEIYAGISDHLWAT